MAPGQTNHDPPATTSASTPHRPHVPPVPPPPESPLDLAFLTNLPGTGSLILVRHGQQRWPEGTNPAQSEYVDPPLSERGRRQAQIVGQSLAGEPVAAVYSSRLERAHQTGIQIGLHHGLEPQVLDELREIEMFRDLPTGKSIRDVVSEAVLRGMRARFVQERSWDVYPYSEPSAEFRHRVVTIIEGIVAMHQGQTVVVACHGGVINAYIGHVLAIGEDMFFRPAHASVSRVLAAGSRRVVHSLNEVHHLAAVEASLVTP